MKQKQGEEINGLDTIMGLVGEPPKKMRIPFKMLYEQEVLRQDWNALNVAIVPFCFKCKEPLVWHKNPNSTLFHCPRCKRKWAKGRGWSKSVPSVMKEHKDG